MSIQHIALVLEAADLCAQEKAVLVAFCNHTDPNGKTFAGQERLMREAGMPASTFKRWRRELVERNLLLSQRKGRKGGGRATSDTYVNLAALRAMQDPFFNAHTTDRPEDENPFADVNPQLTGNGPASEPKGGVTDAKPQLTGNGPASEPKGGNGPASEPINGPASEPTVGPPVSPITLTNPQQEPSSPLPPAATKASGASVARIGEGGVATQKDQGGTGLLDHSLAAVSLAAELPRGTGIETGKLVSAITRRLDEGLALEVIRRELLKPLPHKVRSLTGLYLGRLAALTGNEPAQSQPTAVAPRPDAHAYVDRYGSCNVCGLVEDNPRHRVLTAAQTA